MFGGSGSKTNDFIEKMFKTFMPLQSTQDPLWIQYCSALLHLTLADCECHKELWRVILVLQFFSHLTLLKRHSVQSLFDSDTDVTLLTLSTIGHIQG